MIWHILFALKALLTTQVKSTGTTDMHGLWESHVLSQLVKPKVRPFLSSGLSCLTTVKIVDNKLDYNSCHFKHISTYMWCFIYFATKFLLWTSWPWSAVPWLQLVQWSYHQGSVFFCTFCIDFLSENSNADHFEVIGCFACRIQSLIDFCVKEKRAGRMHFFIDASLIRSATNRYCCTVIWELWIRTLVTPHAKSAGQFS